MTGDGRRQNAIEVQGLCKSYGRVEAVRGIDFTVSEGEVFALLGPNGAGKTTTVEILAGFHHRSGGEVSVLGFDPQKREQEFLRQMGIVLQTSGFDPNLTVAETIELFRGYYPTPRPLDEIIEVMSLQEKRNTKGSRLSGGQQRRLDVAIALAGDPKLLFLDEPTTGFDPEVRRQTWEMIKNLTALGKTIFLTTHYMDEAQYLADRVAIIERGKLVLVAPPAELINNSMTSVSFHLSKGTVELPGWLREVANITDGPVCLQTTDPTRTLYELTRWAIEQNTRLDGLNVSRPSLEDIYLKLTRDAERLQVK